MSVRHDILDYLARNVELHAQLRSSTQSRVSNYLTVVTLFFTVSFGVLAFWIEKCASRTPCWLSVLVVTCFAALAVSFFITVRHIVTRVLGHDSFRIPGVKTEAFTRLVGLKEIDEEQTLSEIISNYLTSIDAESPFEEKFARSFRTLQRLCVCTLVFTVSFAVVAIASFIWAIM